MGNVKVQRTSCDRCRSLKIRCLRDNNADKCKRCIRLGSSCSTGATGRPGRPRKGATTAPRQSSEGTQDSNALPDQSPLQCEGDALSIAADLPDEELHQLSSDSQALLPLHTTEAMSLGSLFPLAAPLDLNPLQLGNFDFQLPMPEERSYAAPKNGIQLFFEELSQINVDLHRHLSKIQENEASLTISDFVCYSILSENNVTMAEIGILLLQKFFDASVNVCKLTQPNTHLPAFPESFEAPQHSSNILDHSISDLVAAGDDVLELDKGELALGRHPPPNKLDTPLVLLIISCYVQLIRLLEEFFYHTQNMLDVIGNESIPPLEENFGFYVGAVCFEDSQLQSVFFTHAILHLLNRIDHILGLPMKRSLRRYKPSAHGLLKDPRHLDLLEKELGTATQSGTARRTKLRDSIKAIRQAIAAESE